MLFVLMEILSHARAKNKTNRLKGLKFRTFMGSNDIMAVKWLIDGLVDSNLTYVACVYAEPLPSELFIQ